MTQAVARVVIADDEPLARERLRRLLRAEGDIRLVGEARNGPQAVALIRAHQPHIVLLDIRLPGLNGFDVLTALGRPTLPSVIFVTAFGEHAIEAFQAGAVDYLVKPFEPQRLREALRRAQHRNAAGLGLPPALATLDPEGPVPGRISLRVAGRTLIVPLDDVEYALASNDRCEVFAGGQSWRISESLGIFTSRLPAHLFVRVSRFAVVNLAHVAAIKSKSHGDGALELRRGTQVRVARTCRAEVLARLQRFG